MANFKRSLVVSDFKIRWGNTTRIVSPNAPLEPYGNYGQNAPYVDVHVETMAKITRGMNRATGRIMGRYLMHVNVHVPLQDGRAESLSDQYIEQLNTIYENQSLSISGFQCDFQEGVDDAGFIEEESKTYLTPWRSFFNILTVN